MGGVKRHLAVSPNDSLQLYSVLQHQHVAHTDVHVHTVTLHFHITSSFVFTKVKMMCCTLCSAGNGLLEIIISNLRRHKVYNESHVWLHITNETLQSFLDMRRPGVLPYATQKLAARLSQVRLKTVQITSELQPFDQPVQSHVAQLCI